jgi:hypothetical protein
MNPVDAITSATEFETGPQLATHLDLLIVLTVLLGLLAAAIIWARRGAIEAKAANKAVNGRPASDPILYDMVRDIHKNQSDLIPKVDKACSFIDGYSGSELPNAASVNDLVSNVKELNLSQRRLEENCKELRRDVFKYGCPVKTGESKNYPSHCQKESKT